MHRFLQRLITVPTKEERARARAGAPLNPFKLAAMLSPLQAAFWAVGFLSWASDAADFFAVSLNVARLTTFFGFGKDNHKVTAAITLTVLLRPIGGLLFGLLSDRYGRKWPMVANLVLISAFSLATARVKTFHQFLAVRALFGIGMGGIWGQSCTLALENMATPATGLFSGLLQQGYPFGYILVAIVNLAWVNHTHDDWSILFYFGAILSAIVAVLRLLLPESPHFVEIKKQRRAARGSQPASIKVFVEEIKWLIKNAGGRLVYGIMLVAGLSFLAHASQDVYPLILQKSKGLTAHQSSVSVIVGMTGGIVGGLTAGYVSQYCGRRLTIAAYSIASALLVPAWMLPTTFSGLAAGAFFLQFFVQGMGGVLPALLQDMAPRRYKATFPGVVHQTGVMISACSAQIETTIGDHLQIHNPKFIAGGKEPETIPDYAKVSAIFLAIMASYVLLVVIFGPEYDGRPKLDESDLAGTAGVMEGKNVSEETATIAQLKQTDSATERSA
ncbi:hypothetical protein OC842_006096 [Tilletia horrida]|uniref:Major facilitator superfamily (MFS) profile domain-containing protein n=1 Tax=Tilletia horrida TaxID=155126 RepID=A0AAN6G7W2_9BASI|nr:hypothetical protein OC842_006096 [Tilletia horrida]